MEAREPRQLTLSSLYRAKAPGNHQFNKLLTMKILTLEDYQKAGETFWPKYWYVAKELGEDAKSEDILKVMEAVGGVALKFALEDKEGPFGFNKKKEEETNDD